GNALASIWLKPASIFGQRGRPAPMVGVFAPALPTMASNWRWATSPVSSLSVTRPPAPFSGPPTASPAFVALSSTLSSKANSMTTITPPNAPNAAQTLLQDTAILKRDLNTILELAKATALPMNGEKASVLDTMI